MANGNDLGTHLPPEKKNISYQYALITKDWKKNTIYKNVQKHFIISLLLFLFPFIIALTQ
jgi:hypothetical protein